MKKQKITSKINTYMYLLPVALRSRTCTMISGKSVEESGHGFARMTDIASGVTALAIFSSSLNILYSQRRKVVKQISDIALVGERVRIRERRED